MGEIMMFICSDGESSDEWELGRGQHHLVTAAVDEMLIFVIVMRMILLTIAMMVILSK